METLNEIISELSSKAITTEDGLVTFVFTDQSIKKGGQEFKKLEVRTNGAPKRVYDGYYKVEEQRTEDGYWVLEFTYSGITSSVQFFSIEEGIEELTSFDMQSEND
jgi:hypothetical protein